MLAHKMTISIFFGMLLFALFCKESVPVGNSDDDGGGGEEEEIDSVTVTDIDGNVYNIIEIGNQIWTKEDLRTTRFNDGTSIPLVTDETQWANLTAAAYCYYQNSTNADTIKKYGALYSWYAVNTNKLAPEGWHVPSISEWETLREYLITNGYNFDGTKDGNKIAKAISAKTSWQTSQHPGAIGDSLSTNNKSNFTALPDGCRFNSGIFAYRGIENHWWSSTETYANHAYSIFLIKDSASVVTHAHNRNEGFSVRLIKDQN